MELHEEADGTYSPVVPLVWHKVLIHNNPVVVKVLDTIGLASLYPYVMGRQDRTIALVCYFNTIVNPAAYYYRYCYYLLHA